MKLSRSQRDVLRIIHDAGDEGAPTTASTGGRYVSGNVAASLVRRDLVRHVGPGRVQITAAGCAELAEQSTP